MIKDENKRERKIVSKAIESLVNLGFFVKADSNSYIVNVMFDESKLTEEQAKEFKKALAALVNFDVSKFDPAEFRERIYYAGIYECIENYMNINSLDFCSIECLENLSKEYFDYSRDELLEGYGPHDKLKEGEEEKEIRSLFIKIGGGINARKCCLDCPGYIINKFAMQANTDSANVMQQTINGQKILFPVSMQYVASWLAASGVIGVCMQDGDLTSEGTRKLFDLTRISEEKQEGDKLQSIMNECSAIAELLSYVTITDELDDFMRESSPEELVKYFKDNWGLSGLYDIRPSHIWENYSIAEHTEAVLRCFESTFEDKIPPEIVPLMKLIILSHDLGKGTIAREKEKDENSAVAGKLFNKLRVPPQIKALIDFVVNESQTYTTRHYTGKDPTASKELRNLCDEKLKELFGWSSEELVTGLVRICEMLQTCDSGAYILYGIIRDEGSGHYYHGGNSVWTKGFKAPTDLGRREIHWDNPEM